MDDARSEDQPAAPHAILSGGGTGGHVFPALVLAEELVSRGWKVSWVGLSDGPEATLARQNGLEFHALPARAVLGRGPVSRVGAALTLGTSALRARRLIHNVGCRVVVGTGGFVSAPAVLGARLAGTSSLLFEPNVHAGMANRWLSRWATEAAVAYPQAAKELRCATTVTGVPVRGAFHSVPEELPAGPPRILVLGGSQGAKQLNDALPPALARISARHPDLTVVHQAGREKLEETREAYRRHPLGPVTLEVVPFLDDIAAEMGAAHLIVSRAGAITLAEICAAGRPALLVPLALAGGHQADNATLLVREGGAELLEGDDLAPRPLAATLAGMLSDRQRLQRMGRALRALARPYAASEMADRVEGLGGLG